MVKTQGLNWNEILYSICNPTDQNASLYRTSNHKKTAELLEFSGTYEQSFSNTSSKWGQRLMKVWYWTIPPCPTAPAQGLSYHPLLIPTGNKCHTGSINTLFLEPCPGNTAWVIFFLINAVFKIKYLHKLPQRLTPPSPYIFEHFVWKEKRKCSKGILNECPFKEDKRFHEPVCRCIWLVRVHRRLSWLCSALDWKGAAGH